MSMKNDDHLMRDYNRQMLRAAFRSLFWVVFSERKSAKKFTLDAFAQKIGIGKSSLSRGFNEPQNWTIDKMSDMAEALGINLVIEAHDAETGVVYTPNGISASFGMPKANAAHLSTSSCDRPIVVTTSRPLRQSDEKHRPRLYAKGAFSVRNISVGNGSRALVGTLKLNGAA